MRHLLTLIKIRITGLVTLTAMAGYGLAPRPEWGWRFAAVVAGVFLITAGASAVNMYLERGTDALMNRTRTRPLPMKILTPGEALAIGGVASFFGLAVLLPLGVAPTGEGRSLSDIAGFLGLKVPTAP